MASSRPMEGPHAGQQRLTTLAFGEKLQQFREQGGVGIDTLAKLANIDRSLLMSLEAEARDWHAFPLHGRDLIMRLAVALKLGVNATDELLMTVGFAPLFPRVQQ